MGYSQAQVQLRSPKTLVLPDLSPVSVLSYQPVYFYGSTFVSTPKCTCRSYIQCEPFLLNLLFIIHSAKQKVFFNNPFSDSLAHFELIKASSFLKINLCYHLYEFYHYSCLFYYYIILSEDLSQFLNPWWNAACHSPVFQRKRED